MSSNGLGDHGGRCALSVIHCVYIFEAAKHTYCMYLDARHPRVTHLHPTVSGEDHGFWRSLNAPLPFTPQSNLIMAFRDQLIGAWTLVEYSAHSPKNKDDVIWPMGKNAQGIIMYTSDGYMSAQLQTPGVPNFDPPGTDSEWAEVGKRYVAYTGRFFLDEDGDALGPILVHEMRNSNLPRLVGDRQRRLCSIKDESDGRYLYLTVDKPMNMAGQDRIPYVRWKRLELNRETQEPGSRL